MQVDAHEVEAAAVWGGDNWMKRRWKSGQGRWWSWFLILLINDAAFPEDGAKWKYWQLHTKTSSRRATAMLILLTIIMLGQMINRKLLMTRMLFPSGLPGYFKMQPGKLHKALQDYLSSQDYPQTEGLWAFVNSTSPRITLKCWFLHLNFQGIICLWADKMRCTCYVIWWAGGLQLTVITWQNMHRYAGELYKFLEYGYWWRAAEGSTPIEAILSHLHSLVSSFLS